MLMDYEQELTTLNGQAVTATAYGSKPYDQKGAGDAAIGEPLALLFKVVTANFNTLTSLDVALVGDDDGAGTNEVTLMTKNFLLASLTTALGARTVGIVPPSGTEKKFMRVKFTVNGTNPTTGSIVSWLSKGTDTSPANKGVTI